MKIKLSQPTQLPKFKLNGSFTDIDDTGDTGQMIRIIPNDAAVWTRKPILASHKDIYPIYWTLDAIAPYKTPTSSFIRDASPQKIVKFKPLIIPTRYLILDGAVGLFQAQFDAIIAGVGTSNLDRLGINVTYYQNHTTYTVFLQNHYLQTGVPFHSRIITIEGGGFRFSTGVTDPDQTVGSETLCITGTGVFGPLLGIHSAWFSNFVQDNPNTRAQHVTNVKTMLQKSGKFRQVHYFPTSGYWSTFPPGTMPYGTALAALNTTLADVGDSANVYSKIQTPTTVDFNPQYSTSDIVNEIKTFFNI